jgi:PAS domain S-box-containing protein
MTPAKVLVVEDELIVSRDIQNRLGRLGYEVLGATRSGEDAVRLTAELHPDLILMDIRLAGGMDGIAAAQEIRNRLQRPVVFLTAYADESTLDRARVSEPFGYILKPFDERELRTVIEMALYKHEAESRLRASERRFAVTLSSIGDAVIATDDQAQIDFLNPIAVQLTGWSRAEACGRPVGEVFRIVDEYSREPASDPVAEALRWGRVARLKGRTVLLARDGRETPIDDSGAPIIADDGSVTGAVLVFQDATQKRRTEEALTLFRALIDRANDAIEVIDPESGRFLDANERACQVHGYTRAEYLSLGVPDLDPTMAGAGAWAENVAYVKKHGSRLWEGKHRRRDGSIFPVEVNVTYVHLNRDYLIAVVRDITERKRAEADLRRTADLLRAVADGTNDAVFVKDLQGRYLLFNPAAARFVGRRPEEVIGKDDTELFERESARWLMNRDRGIMASGRTETSEEVLTAAGVTRTYLATKAPYRDDRDEIVGLIGVAHDITERKRAEAEIRQLNEALELRVRERTAELEAANRELDAFSYSVSHDLRAPLRAIEGFSRALVEDYPTRLDARGKEYLQRLRVNVERMGELVNELLELSRVTQSPIDRTQVDLAAIARAVAAELRRDHSERQVEFVIPESLVVRGDPGLLRLVLVNLLGNAFKYTGTHARARIELGRHPSEESVYFVRDDGAGFDMTHADRLFSPFQRLHGAEEFEGTGVGLATVQRIIRRHGGQVWAESAPEKGATFYFSLGPPGSEVARSRA